MRLNVWECAGAGAIAAFGAAMAWVGSSYGVGTLAQMGPGYFPVVLGLLTAGLGVLTFLEVRHSDAPPPEVPWRAALFVFSGVLLWALLVERIGLLIASALLIVLCSLGRKPVKITTMLLTAAGMSILAVVIFIYGFNLPLRVIKW